MIKNNNVLKGDVVQATYISQPLIDYQENPYIECLPEIFTMESIALKFSLKPSITALDRQLENNIRYHVLKKIKNFLQPLPIHFEVERRLSTLIRRGYLARNPLDRAFFERIKVLNELIAEEEMPHKHIDERMNYIRSTADSLSIIGISGIGKSTAIERLLLMYPQLVIHENYNDVPFHRYQIVWLKIDCPYDGSLATLCKSFFKAIDDVLGTTRYLQKYGYLNRVTSTMLLHMTSLASKYGIGVLVIDEIQHLLNSKNNQEEMLNFFVTLSNTVGIPTVLIGTSKAQKLFKGNFRQARRAASEGSIIWDRMKENSREWHLFIETLWKLQVLRNNTDLTDELKSIFYEECQGITSVAVNLFILVQERAMYKNGAVEVITGQLIKKTAREDLALIQPMLDALRNNDLSALYRYEDIMLNLDELMLQHKKQDILEGNIRVMMENRINSVRFKKNDMIEGLTAEFASLNVFTNLGAADIQKIITKIVDSVPIDIEISHVKMLVMKDLMEQDTRVMKKREVSQPTKTPELLPLLKAREKALANQKHPYEEFKRLGYIKSPLEEFYNVK